MSLPLSPLDPDTIDPHCIIFAAVGAALGGIDAVRSVSAITETKGLSHRTTITFTQGDEVRQQVLDILKAELTPKGYKVWREDIDKGWTIVVLHSRPNFIIVIGYRGNRRGYVNVPEAEARRRWLESENKGAPADCIKTEVDEPVETMWFHDEIDLY